MFGRHPRLPIDVEFGLPKTNSGDNSSKSRYVQKLRRRLNYAFQKANKYANQQAQKYKFSYDKSIKRPQLQEKDIVLVKIVAHKGRHKLQDKWEPEGYVVVEQPIAGTPVYRVQPVTGGNIRTLHRNLLLPLGVKLEPDYNSDDSILEDDDSSSDESTVLVDSKPELYGKKKPTNKSQPQSKREKHVEFDSKVDISPNSDLKFGFSDSNVVQESVGKEFYISSEDSSDKVIPEDISLPSQFLLPNLDDSSSDEETGITELNTEAELNGCDNGKEMQSINSEADFLVDTNELLEFIDTMDIGEAGDVNQSVSAIETEQIVTEQDNIDPKSESQFSSFMSYHEGESSSMDPSTDEKELSKSPIEDSTQRYDSGADDHGDVSSHVIAYESNEIRSPSIEVSSPSDPVANLEIVTEDDSVEPAMEVEVIPPRRSARDRKQTQLFGNPLLYRITYHLTPRVVPEFNICLISWSL